MEILEVIREIESGKKVGEITKRRIACAHCGSTWIEIVGLIVRQKEESDDTCLRFGMESENCQSCRFRPYECKECGSRDVYEIGLAREVSEEVSLSFKGIKMVARSSDARTV